MQKRLLCIGILVAASSMLSALPMTRRTHAQTATPLLIEQIELPVGAVLEVMALHALEQPQFAWSLRRQQTFLQASRARIFRARLIEPGSYTLEAHIQDSEGMVAARKQFQITVGPVQSEDTPDAASSGSILLRTDPARDADGRIVLRAGTDVVRLVPHSALEGMLFMDTDATIDTDGDGDSRNDQAVDGTFFATEHTPLYLWLPADLQRRTIVLSDAQRTEDLHLLSASVAQQIAEEERIASERILAEQRDDGSVVFRVREGVIESGGPPLLFEWSFGDGSQSLLTAPVHTYATAGHYDVQVSIRNLQTGAIQETLRARVAVLQTTPPPPVSPDAPDVPDNGKSDGTTGIALLRYWPAFIILLLSILAGFGIMLIIRFLRERGGLQGALDTAESALTSSSKIPDAEHADAAAPESPPAPLALEEAEEAEGEAESYERTQAPAEPQPPAAAPTPQKTPSPIRPQQERAEDSQAREEGPDWLQQGLQKAAATGQDMHSPPPATLQDDAPPADVLPTPAQESPKTPQHDDHGSAENSIGTADADLPPWLQQPPATQDPAATATAAPADDRAAERKRLKRKRYQQNKKAREHAEKNPSAQQDAPVPQATPDTQAAPEASPSAPIAPQEDSTPAALLEQEAQPIPPLENAEGDENVKFIIGADSINEADASGEEKKL